MLCMPDLNHLNRVSTATGPAAQEKSLLPPTTISVGWEWRTTPKLQVSRPHQKADAKLGCQSQHRSHLLPSQLRSGPAKNPTGAEILGFVDVDLVGVETLPVFILTLVKYQYNIEFLM